MRAPRRRCSRHGWGRSHAVPAASPASAARVEERLEAGDAHALSDGRSLPHATRLVGAFDAPPSAGPVLEITVALAALESVLATLTPLDALRGPLAAGSYAVHLLYGP